MGMYQHYTAGHLATAGGFLDQPQVFTEAMAVIATEINSDG